MKFLAFVLLSSMTIVMVIAFPSDHYAANDLPTVGVHAAAATTAEHATASDTDSLRQPRHLIKKLLEKHTEPQVILQPILVSQAGDLGPFAPIYGRKLSSGYGANYGPSYVPNYGQNYGPSFEQNYRPGMYYD